MTQKEERLINKFNCDMQLSRVTSTITLSSIRHLLENGANINSKDENGNTLLHLAVKNDNIDVVKLLLNKGALVNDKTESGRTALHIAVEWGREENIRLLLSKGAGVNSKDKDGRTPLHLVVGKDVYFYGKKIVERFEKITKLLLRNGACIDECDNVEQTALFIAVFAKKERTIKILLDNGAKINAKDSSNMSPLHFAVISNNIDIVRLLLDRGADILAKDKIGSSPLHFAVERNNLSIAKLLLERGAVVDDVRKDRYTALHTAVDHGKEDSIILLLNNEANVHAREESGKNPLHLVAQKNLQGSTKEVVQKYKRIAKLLLAKGVNVNSVTDTGQTVLHTAVIARNKVMVKLLLEHGANVNGKNNYGESPLYCAVKSKNNRIVEFLLKKGADVNDKRNDGRTALHGAVEIEDTNMIHILLEYEADINAKDDKEKSPLSLAIRIDDWISEVLTMYLAKVDMKQISKENLRLLKSNEKLNKFYSNCLVEIGKMKEYKICYKITFFNILTECDRELGRYARSQNAVKLFKSNEYKMQFPIYCLMLRDRFYKGLQRRHMSEIVEESLNFLWKYFNLSDLLIQKVLYYLSFEDLQFMAICSEQPSNNLKLIL
ncbi:hypothetical protein TSAR_008714 [Trichomalopsis sarcophagae]|uniref:Uncharacterized protein n=1 Tax=Trichomalopsis sarcophagae TaxID=543379 RepID=A0A232EQ02_9HYME|nr:hypothetical protein TSAR_008714 [Trichomalopsis sarcophagae]